MAQITERMCLDIIANVNRGQHFGLTQWEEYQLAARFLQSEGLPVPPFTRDERPSEAVQQTQEQR